MALLGLIQTLNMDDPHPHDSDSMVAHFDSEDEMRWWRISILDSADEMSDSDLSNCSMVAHYDSADAMSTRRSMSKDLWCLPRTVIRITNDTND